MTETLPWPDGRSPTAASGLHLKLDAPFEDAVAFVQLEHELAGFETISLTRIDELVAGVLKEEIVPVAMLAMCHAEIARDAVTLDPRIAALLPCTTVIYDSPDDGLVHAHHYSATKAIRDLGCTADEHATAMDDLVEQTGELMTRVWDRLEASDAAVE